MDELERARAAAIQAASVRMSAKRTALREKVAMIEGYADAHLPHWVAVVGTLATMGQAAYSFVRKPQYRGFLRRPNLEWVRDDRPEPMPVILDFLDSGFLDEIGRLEVQEVGDPFSSPYSRYGTIVSRRLGKPFGVWTDGQRLQVSVQLE